MKDEIGSVIMDLEDITLSSEEREMLTHPLVGGIILFARNYVSKEQLTHLCQQVKASRQAPLLIMVDQEGGRVQRFINEFTRLPNFAQFGKLYDKDPKEAGHAAHLCGWLMAVELLSLGIDLSLSPVLDLNKGVSSVIGQRAFHSHPEIVIELAKAFVLGMNEAGMAATGKHFPGHGSITQDTHLVISTDERSLDEITQEDMVPFAGMINAGIAAIMAAHIIYPKINDKPVGFSAFWLKTILRERLGFKGAIFSDDLNMEGANISANYADRVFAAREAGCDFALVCNNRKGVINVLDNLPMTHTVEKIKWHNLFGNFKHVQAQPHQENPRWHKARDLLNKIT